jgi:hypothetical protein
MTRNRGWNVFGLSDKSTGDHAPFLKCPVHFYQKMITDPRDSSVFICPECGLSSPYKPEELTKETEVTAKFGNNKGKMLLQKNTKKHKMVSEQGDKIPENDEDIKMDLAQGHRILSYNEVLPKVEVMKKII